MGENPLGSPLIDAVEGMLVAERVSRQGARAEGGSALRLGGDSRARLQYEGAVEIKDLSDFLRADPRFTTRRKWLIFSDFVYTPTGEKVEEGFRYFTCPVEALTAALARRDFAAIAKLPFALDGEGEPDTSAVRLDLAYTASGAIAAFQPVEFRDHVPTPVSASVVLEGAEAQALRETLRAIDQSA